MAKAAYRSGECLYDKRTKEFHDYRGGELRVIDKWIMTRRGVEASGREAMWNAAGAVEPRKNGRLATEFEIGLPHELTDAQREDLLKNFLKCSDVCGSSHFLFLHGHMFTSELSSLRRRSWVQDFSSG